MWQQLHFWLQQLQSQLQMWQQLHLLECFSCCCWFSPIPVCILIFRWYLVFSRMDRVYMSKELLSVEFHTNTFYIGKQLVFYFRHQFQFCKHFNFLYSRPRRLSQAMCDGGGQGCRWNTCAESEVEKNNKCRPFWMSKTHMGQPEKIKI